MSEDRVVKVMYVDTEACEIKGYKDSALNPTFGPGRYLYEVGLRGSQGITVCRQGVLTLRGSPYAVGVSLATWTTNTGDNMNTTTPRGRWQYV